MACRSLDKGQAALEEVKRATGNQQIFLKKLDLSSLASVRKFAAEILSEESQLDVLINNAGAQTNYKTLTEDGLETNFAANHFGPFLLTNLLLVLLEKTPKSRIVNVSSEAHLFAGKELDFDNLNSEKTWEPFRVYGRTKLANILFTKELARKLKLGGFNNVIVNATHPGGVKTAFLRDANAFWYTQLFAFLAPFIAKSAEEGAQTSVHAAIDEELDGSSGGYYDECKPGKQSEMAKDADLARRFWDISAKYVKLTPEDTIVDKKTN